VEEPRGIPDAYRSANPVLDPLWAEPWSASEDDIGVVRSSLVATVEATPRRLRDLSPPTGWQGSGAAAAADVENLFFLLLGVGSIVPWRPGSCTPSTRGGWPPTTTRGPDASCA
jgi:hypothetical protein